MKFQDRARIFPSGKTTVLEAESQIQKALVVVAYPTEDMWDIKRTRRLSLLSEIFSERLRVQIREKMGAAYSPFALTCPIGPIMGMAFFKSTSRSSRARLNPWSLKLKAFATNYKILRSVRMNSSVRWIRP